MRRRIYTNILKRISDSNIYLTILRKLLPLTPLPSSLLVSAEISATRQQFVIRYIGIRGLGAASLGLR